MRSLKSQITINERNILSCSTHDTIASLKREEERLLARLEQQRKWKKGVKPVQLELAAVQRRLAAHSKSLPTGSKETAAAAAAAPSAAPPQAKRSLALGQKRAASSAQEEIEALDKSRYCLFPALRFISPSFHSRVSTGIGFCDCKSVFDDNVFLLLMLRLSARLFLTVRLLLKHNKMTVSHIGSPEFMFEPYKVLYFQTKIIVCIPTLCY